MGGMWKVAGLDGLRWVATLSLVLVAGCEYMPDLGVDAGRDAGVLMMDGAPPPAFDAGGGFDTGGGIGSESVRSNVLLLIDRSGSMAQPSSCGMASCPSKWDQILDLGGYLAEVKQGARLGAAFFPSTESDACIVPSAPDVPISDALDIDEQIINAARRTRPGGSTPLAAALDMMRLHGGIDDRTRDNNLVILTDGTPNCSCADRNAACERDAAVAAVEMLANADPPVDVYVIGFGTSARTAQDTLRAMAQAAGHDDYYQADTVEELIGRLYQVAIENVSCTFGLDEWPDRVTDARAPSPAQRLGGPC